MCIYIYIYMYVCACVYMYIYIYIYIYIHTYTHVYQSSVYFQEFDGDEDEAPEIPELRHSLGCRAVRQGI